MKSIFPAVLLTTLSVFIMFTNLFSQIPVQVSVEGGTFIQGSEAKEFADEMPKHNVSISGFYISKYEINFDDYVIFCSFAGMDIPESEKSMPISNVSWVNAVMYCNWLSDIAGYSSCYKITFVGEKHEVVCDFSADGFRLPTESEWEFAAKGGIRSKGFLFSGSNNPFVTAWFSENSKKQKHKSGELEPNELGIYDMTGNLAEWCWDSYDKEYYKHCPSNNPNCNQKSQNRVFKGGSIYDKLMNCKISRRFSKKQTETDPGLGFRVVRKM